MKPPPTPRPAPAPPARPGDELRHTSLGLGALTRPGKPVPKPEATPPPVPRGGHKDDKKDDKNGADAHARGIAGPSPARGAPAQAEPDVEVALPPGAGRSPRSGSAASRSGFVDESSWDDAANEVFATTRVRGSNVILPANPLDELDPESLDAFVECTIYEETGAFGEGEPTSPNFPDDWAHEEGTIPPWLAGPIPAEMQAQDSVAHAAVRIKNALGPGPGGPPPARPYPPH
ncbi:MAG TPA: hypothetical protein VKZ63_13480, partial [Kofleriaceae bacterium]|nr:hypothetical protein [Kofleriaceae bacterium]